MPRSAQPWLHELVTALSAPTAVLSEPGGQIRRAGAQGMLHADVRVLSTAVLEVGGAEPAAVSGGLLAADRALFIGAARQLGEDSADPAVRVERERLVGPGQLAEQVRVISVSAGPVVTEVTIRVGADLASIGEIKSGRAEPAAASRPGRGRAGGTAPERRPELAGTAAGAVVAWGAGAVAVRLSAPGATVERAGRGWVLRWPVRLEGRGQQEVSWALAVQDADAVVAPAPDQAGPATGRPAVGRGAGRG